GHTDQPTAPARSPNPPTASYSTSEPRNQAMEHGDAATGSGSRSGAGTSIQVTALDGIVNVNSLFTLAAFLGLAWRPSSDGPGLADGADHLGACAAGDRIESDLVSFHVLAFACFLFSSLVALCLKQIVRTFPHYRRASSAAAGAAVSWTVKINRAALRVGILASAVGSVCGCGFLTMALVNVVQVKLGRLGCGAGGSAAWGAVIPLVTLVPSAMLIYIGIVFYAFTR
uniref:Maternal effect embryo arrest 60 n=3 Tax=Triticinae TaxID=1648030 RepID=A0A453B763_AEGTS